VCGARTDGDNRAVLDVRERSARDGQRAHVERAQQRAVTADPRRPQLRTATPDHRAIGTRPADFDEDASVTFSWKSAPAIPAAGPESIVRIGRRSTSATPITPRPNA